VGKGTVNVEVFITEPSLRAIDDLRMGYLEASDPAKFKRMLQLATLNAAQSMSKPVRAAAPIGDGRKHSAGRLRGAVAARKAKYDKPAALVGIKAGASRGDMKGAWYRWFVVSGTKNSRVTTSHDYRTGIMRKTTWSVRGIKANDFVRRVVTRVDVIEKATDSMRNTVMAFLDGTINRGRYRGR
jgi:hypothetical protein